jgi:hypothetical protein
LDTQTITKSFRWNGWGFRKHINTYHCQTQAWAPLIGSATSKCCFVTLASSSGPRPPVASAQEAAGRTEELGSGIAKSGSMAKFSMKPERK